MSRLIVRRRRDGIVQLRRRRIWHLISAHETAAVFILSAACITVTVALVAALVESPGVLLLLAPVLPVAALGLWAANATRAPAFACAPVDEPTPPRPPRRAA